VSVSCSHCSLPVPAGLVEADSELQFCCNGCRVAYEVIHEHGLDRYYDIRARVDAPQQPASSSGKASAPTAARLGKSSRSTSCRRWG